MICKATKGNRPIPDVLHVPYTYFPDASGGTEVYVRALAQRLSARGYPSAVAAPGAAAAACVDGGLPVYRFLSDARPRLELAYHVSDEIAAEGFGKILAQTRPSIVHLHARAAAVSDRLIGFAHAAGAHANFTEHTPPGSCLPGTVVRFGHGPCDGIIQTKRCMSCDLAASGMPRALARAAGAGPEAVSARAAAIRGPARPLSALRIPSLIAYGRR